MAKKKKPPPKLTLLNDQPIGEGTGTDGLGFNAYADVLSQVAIDTPGPFTVGVFGDWGTGKTSLLRLIERRLDNKDDIVTVWFNAWRYESEEQPIVPLVATIVRAIQRKKSLLAKVDSGISEVVKSLRAVAYGFSATSKVKIPGFAEVEAGFVAKDMIDRKEALTLDPLLDRSLYFEAFGSLAEATTLLPDNVRIVVIIDDLDRCLPDKGIKLLESIKLVLAQPGFIFFLGVARLVVEQYLKHRYKKEFGIEGVEGQLYLDKIVQLPFHIPPHHTRMKDLWRTMTERVAQEDVEQFGQLEPIVDIAAASNPRTAVRFVNNLLVDRGIYSAIRERTAEDLPIHFFALSRSIQQRWLNFYLWISRASEPDCEGVSQFLSRDIADVHVDAEKDPFKTLTAHRELCDLLKSEFGRDWLNQHAKRNASIDFLRRERTGSEREHSIGVFIQSDLARADFGKRFVIAVKALVPEAAFLTSREHIETVRHLICAMEPGNPMFGPVLRAHETGIPATIVLAPGEIHPVILDELRELRARIVRLSSVDEIEPTVAVVIAQVLG